LGSAALPALKRAVEDPSPEVRARVHQLIHAIEFHHVPGRPANHGHVRTCSVSISADNAQRSIDVNDEGRQIKIVQSNNGIDMTVTGELDGHSATENFNAATPDELKVKNPEAYALYQRWASGAAGSDGVMLQGNFVVQGNGNIVLAPPAPFVRPGGDDLTGLRTKLEEQMAAAKLSPEQKRHVRESLDEVEQRHQLNLVAPDEDMDERMRKYNQSCDDLRKTLNDLKLPDPGDTLPPPQGARLGISVQGEGTGGLTVSHVVPHSRADRLGLQDDDLIRKVNGTAVTEVKDLRRLVTEHAKDLVIDITRDGRDMKVKEK
jgi:hypothetical protein